MIRLPQLNLMPKLTMSFLLFAIVLLGTISVITYYSGRNGLEAATRSALVSLATEKRDTLTTWINERQSDIEAIVKSPGIREMLIALIRSAPDSVEARSAHNRLVTELRTTTDRALAFSMLWVMNPETGQIIAATDPAEEGKFKEDRPYFINGKNAFYIQNPYYSLSLQRPTMTMAVPFRADDGQLLAVLAGQLNLNELNAIIVRRAGLQQTDDAFLVNAANLFITQPRLLADTVVLQRGIHTEAVNRCITRNSGVTSADDDRGIPAIIPYQWLPEREMCLIVKVDQSEALEPIQAFEVSLIVSGGLALLLDSMLAIGLAKTLTRPIQLLQIGVTRFGEGDFTISLPESSRDELGLLAHYFNVMAANIAEKENQLHDYAGQLEQKVEERTAALLMEEERFRTVIESAPVGISLARDGVTFYANAQYLRMFGYQEPEEVNGHLLTEQIAPQCRAEIAERAYRRAQGEPVPNEYETIGLRKDGSQFPFMVSVTRMNFTEVPATVGFFLDVSQREQAEVALQQSEARYHSLFENAPICLWEEDFAAVKTFLVDRREAGITDLPAYFHEHPEALVHCASLVKIVDVNQAGLDTFGASSREAFYNGLDTLFIDESYAVFREELMAFAEGKNWFEAENIGRTLRGEPIDYLVRVTLVHGYADTWAKVFVAITDITARKRAEAARRASENRFRALIEHSSDAVLLIGIDGQITYASPSAWRVLGYKSERHMGRNLFEWIHPDDLNNATTAFMALIQQPGGIMPAQLRIRHQDGSWRLINGVATNLLTEPDVQALVLNYRDITQHRQAEEALRMSEAQYRSLFENMLNGFAYCKMIFREGRPEDFLYLAVNRTFETLTGLQQVVGKKVTEVIPSIHESDPGLFEIYGRVALTGQPEQFEVYVNSLAMWFSIAVYSPRPEYFVAVFDVITERKQAEAALRQSEAIEREQRSLAEALRDTITAITRTLDLDTVMTRILENLDRVVSSELASILLIKGNETSVVHCRGLSAEDEATYRASHLPLTTRTLATMITTQAPILIDDTEIYSGWVNIIPSLRSYIGVPIQVHNQVIGFLSMNSTQPGFFTAVQAERLRVFADQAAIAIENAQLYDELRRHAQQLEQRVNERTAELRQAKEHVEAILNNSSDGIILVDITQGIQQSNPAFRALFACEPDACFHVPLVSLVAAADAKSLEEGLQAACATQSSHRLEVHAQRYDGSTFEAEVGIAPVLNTDGVTHQVVCTLRDISARKVQERQLRYYASVQNDVNDAVMTMDLQYRIQSWNQAAERIYGWKAEEVVGRNVLSEVLRAPQESEAERQRILQTFQQHGNWHGEIMRLHKDGTLVSILASTTLLKDEHGVPFGLVAVHHDITERKAAEIALRDTQQMLRSVLDTIPVRVFWKDRNSVYLGCNRLFAEDAGLEHPVDIVGKQDSELPWFATEAATYRADDLSIMESGTPRLDYEETQTNASGKSLFLQTSKLPLCDAAEQVIGVLGVYVDISHRKEIEDTLRQYTAEVEDLYNNAPCGYHSLDENGVIMRINDTELRWLGYSREEVIGKLAFADLFTPASLKTFQTSFPVFKARGWVKDLEFDLTTKDGKSLAMLVNGTAIYDEEGRYRMSRSTLFDITDLKRTQNALRESEARFRSYFELPLIGMAITSPKRGWMQVNNRLCEILGYTRQELLSTTWTALTHPDDLPMSEELFWQAMAGERDGYVVDKRYIRKDGRVIDCSAVTRCVRHADGRVNYFVVLIEDISERKRLESDLRKALDKEKELNELKTRFVSIVSHEFRTPLAAIQMASDILGRYSDRMTEAQRAARLVSIHTEVQHMTKLLEEVLVISRAEAGRLEFHPRPVDIQAFCQNMLNTMQALSSGHQFAFSSVGNLFTFMLDADILQHVLNNLLTNAVKYSPEGSTVHLNLVTHADRVTLQVRDAGIGIPPEDQVRLFEAFHRATNVGNAPGTGLGLTIVKQMVERHGGSISFESEVGRGSTFTVTIPAVSLAPTHE